MEMTTKRRGQALVEFALVLPVFVLLLMGVVDFGRAVYAYNTLGNASRAGVRVAVVDQNSAAITDKARSTAIGIPASDVNVAVAPSPPCTMIGCETQVTVTYSWRPLTPIISNIVGSIKISSTTSMPVERVYVSP
jgi:Flp pilus assembly protein TadG